MRTAHHVVSDMSLVGAEKGREGGREGDMMQRHEAPEPQDRGTNTLWSKPQNESPQSMYPVLLSLAHSSCRGTVCALCE